MKNIFKIFKRDLKNIFTNSMAIILAVGIAVLPSLYAWFNIYANWDPYGSTGNMQVAVVIEDEGYNYRNIDINVGEKIKQSLAANDLIDWQFISKKEALSGIKSGKYYAAIEIPKGFSQSLTSIVSSEFKQPQITYYANEKKNAIATKITDKVVQTVQLEVNESFITTVINVLGGVLEVVAQNTKDNAGAFLTDLHSKIDDANDSIASIKKTMESFESLMKVTQTLSDATDKLDLQSLSNSSEQVLKNGADMAKVLQNSISVLGSSVDTAFVQIQTGLNGATSDISAISGASSAKAAELAGKSISKVSQYKAKLQSVKTALESVKSSLSLSLPAIDKLISKINTTIIKTDKVISALTAVKKGESQTKINQIISQITSAASDVSSFRSDYKNNVKPVIVKNLSSLIDMLSVTGNLIAQLKGEKPALDALASALKDAAKGGGDLIGAIDKLLTETSKELSDLAEKIDGLKDSEIVNAIQNMAGKDSERVGEFIACPVKVDTKKIYGIENYGSAMAPFYSTLALWVGAMILIAVVKTEVKKKNELGALKSHQTYLGRMLIFLLFSVTQSLIICLGDLYFLKIQCYHPFKFIFAAVAAAVAFTVFIYSITAAFGDIGKAIGIVFLVVQIGGSGGTFPIDVTPKFFRVINPYLPFTFVIEAMRECVCGTYANNYWIYLLKLLAYVAIGLIIGLFVKLLVKKPIRFFDKRIKQTGLF